METFHQRLAMVAFGAGDELGLVLAGGYAVSAHHLIDRPSRDLDFATASPLDLPDVATRLSAAYERAGYHVSQVESTSRMARLEVGDGQQSCEVDLLKEAIGPPVQLEIGPVLTLDDAELRDDRTFRGYGLDDAQIAEVRRWALGWAADIRARTCQTGPGEGRTGTPISTSDTTARSPTRAGCGGFGLFSSVGEVVRDFSDLGEHVGPWE